MIHSCVVALVSGVIACGSSDTGDLFGSPSGGAAAGVGTTGGHAGGPMPIGGSSVGGMSGGGATGGDAGSSTPIGGSTAGAGAAAMGGSAGAASSAGSGGGGSTPAGGAGVGGSISAGTGGAPVAGSAAVAGTGGTAPCERSQEICDGVDNDCDEQVDEGRTCASACQGFTIAGHGYMYCSMANTLNQASQLCEAEGMHLAWIESEAENTALLDALSELVDTLPGPVGPEPGVRVGATDAEDEGEWSWIDGSAFWDGDQDGEPVNDAFTNWASGSPDNGNGAFSGQNCAVLLVEDGPEGRAGEWNDVRCTQAQPFVCELP